MKKLRIFMADDHPIVREGMKALVNAQADMEVVGEAADGRTAVEQISQLLPDIVVMDISMPHLNGIHATEELHRTTPQVKVVALTVHEDRSYLRQLMEAGASGFVLKRAASDDLVHALRTVADGRTYVDPVMAAKVMGKYTKGTSLEKELGRARLSEREEDVLKLIAAGLSNKEIAARLAISVKTVETYKARSLQKLGLHSRADIVRYSVSQGWLQEL
jgi:DNA-binding NarL/FixJ family response regulator